jgi:AcrR family transcriptional regulator
MMYSISREMVEAFGRERDGGSGMAATPSLRERNRARTTAEILDAAALLLGDPAGAAFTLEELAQKAGVSRGTVYAYFEGGRDQIIREVYVRAAADVRERAELLREEQTEPADRITALARGFLEVAAHPTGHFYGAVRPDVAAIVADHLGSTSGRVSELILEDLREVQAKGGLASGLDPAVLATLLSGAMRAAGERAAREPADLDDLIRTIRELVARVTTT